MPTLHVDGEPIEARPGDSLLVAMLRAGLHPTGGGCLCAAGDCPHCLATVDGAAWTRTCQVRARAGLVVRRSHFGGEQPHLLPDHAASAPVGGAAPAHHVHCDTVVIGQGDSGREAAREARAAGQDVVTLDAGEEQQVTGVYPGPLVVASDRGRRVLHVHPRREIVVAAGAAEIQPVVPGSDLEGIVTARAAAELAAAGLDLGRVAAVGEVPRDLVSAALAARFPLGAGGWDLVRFEGDRRLEAVVVRRHGDGGDALEERFACDTAVLGLGRHPRNALARMAADLPVRLVGGAAAEADLPPCPRAGTVCPCSGVTVADLDSVWRRGFREMELLKRATLAGTGACQGVVCLPWLRSFLRERGGRLQPAFTARPLVRQLTVRELAAGAHPPATARTPLHDEHLRLGARMDRAGGWWRPWSYCRPDEEAAAVRERVSLGDLSPLGKTAIAGPDALAFLERILPIRVAAVRPGRCRSVFLLDERGYVFDDGVLCREAESGENGKADRDGGADRDRDGDGDRHRFFLTSTAGGSEFLELWLRDWAEAFDCDVRIMNRTASLAAIHVTGPLAARLLARAGCPDLPATGRHRRLRIAGIVCRAVRPSLADELSVELYCAAVDARRLWRRLLAAGSDLGVCPHGLETLLHVRVEQGRFVVGRDTDYDSTPRRLGVEQAVDMTKGEFVGRQAILRTNRQPLDRRLVALRTVEFPSGRLEGAAIRDGGRYAGHVTSAARPGSGRSGAPAGTGIAMLGWLYLDEDGNLPREVTVDGRAAERVDRPLRDPAGEGARTAGALDRSSRQPPDTDGGEPCGPAGVPPEASSEAAFDVPAERPEPAEARADGPAGPAGAAWLRPLEATRVAAAPAALDALAAAAPWPADALALRIAPDELLVTARPDFEVAGDPHVIVERETGLSHVWLDAAAAELFLDRECDWERPGTRPAFAQGEVAGVPARLWCETERTLILTPSPFAAALERRLAAALATADGSGGR